MIQRDSHGDLSFVIPTYNRSNLLPTCLEALDREYRAGCVFEVVLVDDGSTDGTVELVRGLRSQFAMQVEVLQQQNRGPAAARNRGVEAAQGELVVFMGDDIIVQPGYVRAMRSEYDSGSSSPRGVLGHTRYSPDSIPTPFGRWLDSGVGLQFAYRRAKPGEPLHFTLFYSSNLLVPRVYIIEAGGFNPAFRHAAYEDTELGYRLTRSGFQLYYAPNATAIHVHPASVRAFASRMAISAGGFKDLQSVNPQLFETLRPRVDIAGSLPEPARSLFLRAGSPRVVDTLDAIDRRSSWPLPGIVYHSVMKAVVSRELRNPPSRAAIAS